MFCVLCFMVNHLLQINNAWTVCIGFVFFRAPSIGSADWGWRTSALTFFTNFFAYFFIEIFANITSIPSASVAGAGNGNSAIFHLFCYAVLDITFNNCPFVIIARAFFCTIFMVTIVARTCWDTRDGSSA